MVRRQTFRFSAESETLVEDCLRGLGSIAELDEERESFLYTNKTGEQAFRFQCVIVQGGVASERSGNYFAFLGQIVEALAKEFGKITIEHDA